MIRRCAALLLVLLPAAVAMAGENVSGAGSPLIHTTSGTDHVEWVNAGTRGTFTVTYHGFDPYVVSPGVVQPLEFSVRVTGAVDAATLELANGTTKNLTDLGGGLFSATLSHAEVLYDYAPDDVNHNFVGFLDLFIGATWVLRGNMFIDVHDSSVPYVPVRAVAASVQAGPHVVNIFDPTLDLDNVSRSAVAADFYQHFPDDFDTIAILTLPNRFENRSYFGAQNEVSGIGLSLFDDTAAYGSSGRLKGTIRYPVSDYFDMAETAALHEIGHKWSNFLGLPELQGVFPHWPLSTLARGVMGTQGATLNQGLTFPYTITSLGAGEYRLDAAPVARAYNDMELYLMGMLAPEAVGTQVVFVDQAQTLCDGCILHGPVELIDATTVAAFHGPRVPSYIDSQKTFTVATVVVTKFRLLTQREMEFFDYFAARGMEIEAVPFTSGFARGETLPFFPATGGRGRLVTSLDVTSIYEDGFESGDLAAWD
jgi:hypothetical protein